MTLKLPTDIEQYVDEKLRSGEFTDANEFIAGALSMYRDQERLADQDVQELREQIAVGIAQSEDGRIAPWNPDEVKAAGRTLLESRKRA